MTLAYGKTSALMVAIMMVAVAGFVAVASDVDADPSTGGSFDVYLRTNTTDDLPDVDALDGIDSDWVKFSVDAFDATKAVLAVNTVLGLAESTYSINSEFDKEITSGTYSYWDVDPDYGEITTYLNLTDDGTNSWIAWVYVGGQWQQLSTTAGMGHYRPFADYVTDHQTANIALYYGASEDLDDLSLPGSITKTVVSDISSNANFAVTFTLKDKTGETDTYDVLNVVAYGSDVYAALKNLTDTQGLGTLVGTDVAGQYYSWITTINGKTNASSSPWTPYWAFFDNSGSTPVYTSFTMGFYTPLSDGYSFNGAALTTSNVLLTYGSGTA